MKNTDLCVDLIVAVLNHSDGCAVGIKYATDVTVGGFDHLPNLNMLLTHFSVLVVRCLYDTSVALVARTVQWFSRV